MTDTFNTAELAESLEEKGYKAIDDMDNVIVEDVEDFPTLFEEVRDSGVVDDFKITRDSTSFCTSSVATTAYIDPRDANY